MSEQLSPVLVCCNSPRLTHGATAVFSKENVIKDEHPALMMMLSHCKTVTETSGRHACSSGTDPSLQRNALCDGCQ